MALSSKSWDVETATELLLSNWTYSTMITTHAPLSRFPTPLTPPMSKLDSLPIWIKKHLDSPTQCIYESLTSFSLSVWHYSLFLNSHIISNLRRLPPPFWFKCAFPSTVFRISHLLSSPSSVSSSYWSRNSYHSAGRFHIFPLLHFAQSLKLFYVESHLYDASKSK